MTNEAVLFLSNGAAVWLLSFQSLNVNTFRFGWAIATAFLIAVCNLTLYKFAPTVSSPTEIVAFLVSGPVGITLGMLTYKALNRGRST